MKVRRRLVAVLAVVCGAVGLAAVAVPVANAASGPIFTVMNTSESLPDGVYFRNSPHTADTSRITGLGVYKNERVQLQCYATGDAVGAFNDKLWYRVNNVTRPTVGGRANVGYLNAHYINDGKNANVVDAGVPKCGPPTIINGINVGYAQNARHTWGTGCVVQDFNGGPSGWVIVGYSNGTNIVRNGMLWGWFDNGGGPGLGCPVNQEHSYGDGVRQDFTHGSLYWATGMDHARRVTWNDFRHPIWAGYAATYSTANVTSVRGSWNVPKVTCAISGSSYMSVWVGIDGVNSTTPDLVQAGSGATCSGKGAKPQYNIWTEVIPRGGQAKSTERVITSNVSAGDAVAVDISYGLNNKYTIVVTLRGVKQKPVTASVVGLHISAECVAEAPLDKSEHYLNLAAFGSAVFTSCQMARKSGQLFPVIAATDNGASLHRLDMQLSPPTPLRATPGLPRTVGGSWAVLYRSPYPS